MRLPLVVILVAGCSKDPPAASPPPVERKPVAEVRRPTVARPSRQRPVAPALPEYNDVNPPGVPRLTGPVEKDRGVSYVDDVVGTGRMPEKGKLIQVHYAGWLTDGTMFDSSRDRAPIELRFDTGQVIKGWDIGLSTMRVGGKRRIVIPADLGYGSNARGPIPADAVLVFD